VGEAIAAHILASENPNRNPKLKPKETTPILIIAGGAILETLICCLTGGRPREERIIARLGGGDAVLLSSPAMCGITGEGLDEKWRPNSNLWDEAMRRDDWVLAHHLRGDGKGHPIELGGSPKVKPKTPAQFKTRLTAQWNRYAGSALILTDSQYLDIRRRAGFPEESGMGFDKQLNKTIFPLVKDYVMPVDDHLLFDDHRRKSRRSLAQKSIGSLAQTKLLVTKANEARKRVAAKAAEEKPSEDETAEAT